MIQHYLQNLVLCACLEIRNKTCEVSPYVRDATRFLNMQEF